MASFSEKIGVVKPNRTLQVTSINEALRNSLWNLFLDLYEDDRSRYWKRVADYTAKCFRKVPKDELPSRDYDSRTWVKEYFYSLEWYRVYDFIEFLVHNHRNMTAESYGVHTSYHRFDTSQLISVINAILERELSGFRFIQGELAPITNPVEIAEIDDAVEASRKKGLHGAREHICTAVRLLSKKPDPDYRNAIKEAISAVESVAKQITGSDTATLDAALKQLSSKMELHGALKAGFLNLYGFTSDESGIRHAILDQPTVGFVEAKYMTVVCSAFVNYLIVKADGAGLLK
ncbi:AbiJ-NTD4 domain-containing protein [Candidatus Manganitrophus noduliformans]|uniref:HEPN AbiJ-N-terminal domain-containing protein n=1 Tax=Candidatus Manganitrophus noduliformans TaxID=2606439 RepID=A0A7X6DNE4_9BACT|nr:hypothetical protein [Candidatus Manganitrophus noduliformans]NKE70350.1 hypothetical protein [Candidatus Manganitrophus noduliformans]